MLRLAVRGWIALAQDVTAHWLEQREPPRAAVCLLLERTLVDAVAAAQAIAGGS